MLVWVGVCSLIKFVLGIGILIGGVMVLIFNGVFIYVFGEVFKCYFDLGGIILDFDIECLKKFYKEKFEKGKKVV